MKKKLLLIPILVLTLLISAVPVLAVGPGVWLVDIGNPASETQPGIAISGWGPIEPLTSGGSWGGFDQTQEDCRVMWDTLQDPCADVTYTYDECVWPTYLEFRHLDGIADDSMDVYVDGVMVWSYTDNTPIGDPEVWYIQSIDLTQFLLPNSQVHVVEFCATGVAWQHFGTYGQVAIDWVELTTDPCEGNTEVDVQVEVLEELCVCIDVTGGLNFGQMYPGDVETLIDAITITNCGDVDVDVTVTSDSQFWDDNLELEGSWMSLASWTIFLPIAGSEDIDARLTVPDPYSPGVELGMLIFWATPSP